MKEREGMDINFLELMNELPDSVVWAKPVFQQNQDGENKISHFKLHYANASAQSLIQLLNQGETRYSSVSEYIQKVIATPTIFLQYKLVYETGEKQEFNYYNPAMDKHFHVIRKKAGPGILVVHRDRTDEEKADREKDVKTEFVQSMLNASLHGVMLMKPVYNNEDSIYDFVVLAANTSAENHFRGAPGTLNNRMISTIASRFREMGFYDTYISALQTNQVQRRELYYEDDMLKGWYDLGVAPINGSLVVTFENITDKKDASKIVEEAAAYLQTVIDIVQVGILVFTPVYNEAGDVSDFKFRVANRSLASYVGEAPSAVEGALASKWFPSYKSNGLFAKYRDTFITGKSSRFDFHYNADGIDVWLDIMSTKLDDDVLVTFSDYTALKKLQQQLETSVKELKRSNDKLTEFAYVASHDLQEPLRKINTFGNLLVQRSGDALGEDGKMLIERMQNASERMRNLISDLLNFSQMNTMVLNVKEVDLNELVNEVLADLDNLVQENSVEIDIDKLPVIKADRFQLRQLFQNLFSNAIKFRHAEVQPRITLSAQPVAQEDLERLPYQRPEQKSFYKITVRDNGIGFDEQYAQQIFQIFQRLHGRSDYPGTGIGLAIVQKVIENHDGYIYAESTPGKGASFHMLLPKE